MNKYKGLIECLECARHKFKGRKERNNINYRRHYRLKTSCYLDMKAGKLHFNSLNS